MGFNGAKTKLFCAGFNSNKITELKHNVFNNFVQHVIDQSSEVNKSFYLRATEPTTVCHGKQFLCPALSYTN